jgi:hypothetical protein
MPFRAEQPSFTGGEISPALAARLDVAKYHTAVKKGQNVILLPEGGMTSRPGFEFVGPVHNDAVGARVVPFQFSSSQSYALLFGDNGMEVAKSGALVLEAPKPINGLTFTQPSFPLQPFLTVNAHGYSDGDQVYITDAGGFDDSDNISTVNDRLFTVDVQDANTFTLRDLLGAAYLVPIDTNSWQGGGTVARVYSTVTPYDEPTIDLFGLKYAQSADVMYVMTNAVSPHKLVRTGETNWTFSPVNFGASISAPTGISVTAHDPGGGTDRAYRYLVTAIDATTGEESLHSDSQETNNDLSIAGAYNQISWTAVPNAVRYNVYEESNGIYGFIGGTTDATFRDNNISPDLGDTPPYARNVFTGPGNFPAAVAFHEQRLVLGGTENKVNGVWTSQTGNYENLNVSVPPKADDAVTLGLVALKVNEIMNFVSLTSLLAFTSDTLFKITGGGVTDYITPTSIVVRPAGYRGAAAVSPITVDDVVLYVTAKGAGLRTINYEFAQDNYRGNNISVFVRHLLKGRQVVEMTWCEHPFSAIFIVLDNGVMLCLVWVPDQEVWGFTRIVTDGAFESCCSITENAEDRLYVVVRRTINGHVRRYVERMASPDWATVSDAIYADAARTYSGTPAKVFAGLEHLEGKTVSILADGAVKPQQVVTGGKIRLDANASKVVVGLPYDQIIHTLEPNLTGQGQAVGKTQKIGGVVVRVQDTWGIKIGPDEDGDEMFTAQFRSDEPFGSPPSLYTGDIRSIVAPNWTSRAGVAIVQSNPLPSTILGVYADVDVGG